MRAALIATALFLTSIAAAGAHELQIGAQHVNYSNWKNKADKGCCNDHDCAPVGDDRVRIVGGHYEVRLIVGDRADWCEVLPTHFLQTGNAPDWSTAHVCVEKTHVNGVRVTKQGYPCSHLLCFQPKPQF